MKIRHLEQKLKKSGYRFRRFGQGNHPIFEQKQTRQTISICGQKLCIT